MTSKLTGHMISITSKYFTPKFDLVGGDIITHCFLKMQKRTTFH